MRVNKFIVLNHSRFHPAYSVFSSLDGKTQIDIISNVIAKVCEQLKATDSEKRWIIVMREYAVTNLGSMYVTNDIKKYFNQEMCRLTKSYPQLVIIGGTLAVKKPLSEMAAVSKAVKIFLQSLEPKYKKMAHNTEYDANILKVSQFLESLDNSQLLIVRNTCRAYAHGTCIGVKEKISQFHETTLDGMQADADQTIFQFFNKHQDTSVFILPPVTGEPEDTDYFSLGVEICFENKNAILSAYLQETDLPKPQMQCLISDWTAHSNIATDFLLHVDSMRMPAILYDQSKGLSPPDDIIAYSINLLDDDGFLMDVPFIPFRGDVMLDIIDEYLSEITNQPLITNVHYFCLEQIRRFFIANPTVLLDLDINVYFNQFAEGLRGEPLYDEAILMNMYEEILERYTNTLITNTQFDPIDLIVDPEKAETSALDTRSTPMPIVPSLKPQAPDDLTTLSSREQSKYAKDDSPEKDRIDEIKTEFVFGTVDNAPSFRMDSGSTPGHLKRSLNAKAQSFFSDPNKTPEADQEEVSKKVSAKRYKSTSEHK